MKPEIRNPKFEGMPKSEVQKSSAARGYSCLRAADLLLWSLLLVSLPLIFLSSGHAASSETNGFSIPQSVFDHPRGPSEGKDPFFPKSMGPYTRGTPQRVFTAAAPVESVRLKLNGITGPPKRSAMINGRTFEAGEEAEVKNEIGGKMHIKCVEIKDESVTIELPTGERQELKLRTKLY
jgi:hypothetical protein